MSPRYPRAFDAESRSDPDFPYLSLEDRFPFPDAEDASGTVVAVGGNLSPGMIVSAYVQGIFPWFNEDDPIYWQSPDPRFVVFPDTFHVPSRLDRSMRKSPFTIRTDTQFERVIALCSGVSRDGQNGSWITDDMIDAYVELHYSGIAHSIEAWMGGELVGGFYGILLGNVFFGESMFTRVSDASKTAFAFFARRFFGSMGGKMIDSQVYTDHIARFGGVNVSRSVYLRRLREGLGVSPESWLGGDSAEPCESADESSTDFPFARGLWRPDFLY